MAPEVVAAAKSSTDELLRKLESGKGGLTQEQASARLIRQGFNQIIEEHRETWAERLLHNLLNPLVILLIALATISFFTGDRHAGIVMTAIVVLSVGIRYVQEYRADAAEDKLKAMMRIPATVTRDSRIVEIPLREIVPGDLIQLSAGDMIPGDVRVLSSRDLFVNQAALTGESFPMEKFHDAQLSDGSSPSQMSNICFMGTSVESGTATAVVIITGERTYFSGIARSIALKPPSTTFERGISRYTWLMIRLMAIMTPLVFVINGLTKHDWKNAFLFAVAVAVGLTPEMLPMIVSVCLSKGALSMSRKRVIVKRLDAIQSLGEMDVLCTDKTGTLTLDRVILERHCDVAGNENDDVLLNGYLISHFQTGLKNVLDRAVLNCRDFHDQTAVASCKKLDEIPFDFGRRMMSVVLEKSDAQVLLISKGAFEEVISRCSSFELDGEISPIDPLLIADLKEEHDSLSSDGFRVLAIAYREIEKRDAYSKQDERALVLKGYMAFLDPPKETAAPAIKSLGAHGLTVKVLTGDNALVSQKVCSEVGLVVHDVLSGPEIEKMSDRELALAVENYTLFARLLPAHKQRIICALQSNDHVVGFLGDGINDAPALHIADVGISVDTAVDVAKAAAPVLLLEKSLMVLDYGVIEGRKVFANILKYIRMGASSNFGNMFSVLGASIVLPFLPMAPLQILTNNLLYDLSQTPIPTDDVDAEQLAHPRRWQLSEIRKFIFCIGPISSIFDFITFAVLLGVFGYRHADQASFFQTGWFVESLITQTLIIHIVRTNQLPFMQSRASWPLTLTTLLIITVAVALPYSPLAVSLGFVPLPPFFWPLVGSIVVLYALCVQVMKTRLLRQPVHAQSTPN